jgi:hypothetical protein
VLYCVEEQVTKWQLLLLLLLLCVVQVVSRAHRMGAVAPVHVELLAMKHTAEEHMVNLR